MTRIEKILFPTDLTAYSLTDLEYAVQMSKLYNSRLYILYILDTDAYENVPASVPEMNDLHISLEENGRIAMNRYIRENIKDNSNIIQTIIFGKPDEVILEFVESENIDLIIMEALSLHPAGSSFSANIIEKVFAGAQVPILQTNKPGPDLGMKLQSIADRNFHLNTFGMSFFN